MSQFNNLGHAYYREYYSKLVEGNRTLRKSEEINYDPTKDDQDNDTINRKWIRESLLVNQKGNFERIHNRLSRCATHVIQGVVTGDGFLTGTGYEHQKWNADHKELKDVQMGLDFDPSTGVPVLRGSGLKGGLRAWIDPLSKDGEFVKQRKAYFNYVTKGFDCENLNTDNWKKYLFEGGHPISNDVRSLQCQTPAYLGLVPCLPKAGEALFQLRNLAPQESPTSDITPINFMSLKPGTKVCVYFSFPRPAAATAENFDEKVSITLLVFAYYISHFGLGAKRRYGYGRLRDIKLGKITH